MNFSDYQALAAHTDRLPEGADEFGLLPLIGLGGEVGQLMAEYKKRERDRDGYRAFRDEVEEELGDILWYAAALARRNSLDLGTIAELNLEKSRDLFDLTQPVEPLPPYDADLPESELFPRRLTVTFVETEETNHAGEVLQRVRMFRDAHTLASVERIGDALDDNSERADDYRYHDVFHLAHMAVLGWSPVLRRLLGCKRETRPAIDRIEDGGRAAAIEEGVTAFVFSEASSYSNFATSTHVPPSIVKLCRRMTDHLEVKARSRNDWQHTILRGYGVFRQVVEHRGGIVSVDLDDRTITFDGPVPT